MRALSLVLLIFAGPVVADVTPFQTPSGNIECYVGTGEAPSDIGCTIYNRAGPPALPRPDSCKGAWGHHFSMMERGKVEMKCGDPGEQDNDPDIYVEKATYGQTGEFGGITCQSSRKGLECKNADGHGFFLSRKRQSVF